MTDDLGSSSPCSSSSSTDSSVKRKFAYESVFVNGYHHGEEDEEEEEGQWPVNLSNGSHKSVGHGQAQDSGGDGEFSNEAAAGSSGRGIGGKKRKAFGGRTRGVGKRRVSCTRSSNLNVSPGAGYIGGFIKQEVVDVEEEEEEDEVERDLDDEEEDEDDGMEENGTGVKFITIVFRLFFGFVVCSTVWFVCWSQMRMVGSVVLLTVVVFSICVSVLNSVVNDNEPLCC